jgi:hypothetical protein
MARFQATIAFEVEGLTTQEEALAYVKELASDEMDTTGELVEVVEVEIT